MSGVLEDKPPIAMQAAGAPGNSNSSNFNEVGACDVAFVSGFHTGLNNNQNGLDCLEYCIQLECHRMCLIRVTILHKSCATAYDVTVHIFPNKKGCHFLRAQSTPQAKRTG
eukprot:4741596-Amphidinium_carterae.1